MPDLRIKSVILINEGDVRGRYLQEYMTYYSIDGKEFRVQVFHDNEEWYTMTAHLDEAMNAYFPGKDFRSMKGKMRGKFRHELADRIVKMTRKSI